MRTGGFLKVVCPFECTEAATYQSIKKIFVKIDKFLLIYSRTLTVILVVLTHCRLYILWKQFHISVKIDWDHHTYSELLHWNREKNFENTWNE